MKRILSFILLALALFSLLPLSAFAARARKQQAITYLLAGMDGAAANTDFLALVSFNKATQNLVFLQIPRDTFIVYEGSPLKINEIYPHALSGEGKPQKKKAMQALVHAVSDFIGMPINGYGAIAMDDFAGLVDAVGGIDVTLPFPLTFGQGSQALTLSAGKQHLNGDLALRFVRYRKGYAMGDLARMDVQKIFLAGVIEKCSVPLTAEAFTALVSRLYGRLLTDKSFPSLLADLLQWSPHAKTAKPRFMTLPGAPYRAKDGKWYFAANRKGAQQMLSLYFADASFDPQGKLLDPKDSEAERIYHAPAYPLRVYTAAELKKLNIIPKKESES